MQVGTQWYKCDLHLHTPASRCFRDQTVTPQQWVQEALDKGLNCVAVTDHNTGAWIDEIKAAAQGTGLIIFPGVELTCGDAKVHLLVLFDIDKGRQDVEDFVLKSDIPREKFGEQDAHSPKSVEDIFTLAREHQAICIPAHIDEFNGISEMGNKPRESFLGNKELLGVQVVHAAMTRVETEYIRDRDQTHKALNQYYGENTATNSIEKWRVSQDYLKKWRQAVVQSQAQNKAILTFSDNPHEQGDSRHGLWGIGTRYTWLKMDQRPGLEGLRQALLLHKFRVRNDFDCPGNQKPYKRPEVLIRSVRIENTHISEPLVPFEVQFSPQMTTIVGGRGSGKSTVMQVLRGVFGKERELESLEIVYEDFKRFFRVPDKKKYGILQNACAFEVEIERQGESFRLKYLLQSSTPMMTLHRISSAGVMEPISNYQDFLHLLDFEIYSQKQIYEVATNLNSLREKIDASDEQLINLKKELEAKRDEYKQKATEIRGLEHKVSHKGRLAAEIADLDNKINRYKESALEEYLQKIQVFEDENAALEQALEKLETQGQSFQTLMDNLRLPALGTLTGQSAKWATVFDPLVQALETEIAEFKSGIKAVKEKYVGAVEQFQTAVSTSAWASERENVRQEFQKRKQELSDAGIDEAEKIEEFMENLRLKKTEFAGIEEKEEQIVTKQGEKNLLKQSYIELRQQLTKRRETFLKDLLKGRNVRAKIGPCQDIQDLEKQIRRYLGSDSFEADINGMISLWAFQNSMSDNNLKITQHIEDIRQGGNKGDWSGKFLTKIRGLLDASLDEFDLLFPEDDIKIEYSNSAGQWKPISNASPGQKTAAILTLILSQGTKPLLLDQPEDDLDNRLIYDLVVDQLRISKESRQIIVVTHNANIPVNGDSEHIIVMDAESKHIKPLACGCIEEQPIKDAICEIMEGGIDAFDMRSRRYKNI